MTRETNKQDSPERKPDPEERQRRAYEAPRLIVYGRVKDLTAGLKSGTPDFILQGGLLSNIA